MRVTAEQHDGFTITVQVNGTIEEYAKAFLAIFNNVRENSELLKIKNNSGNAISVTCTADARDDLKQWLAQFGEIIDEYKVLCIGIEDIDIKYDFDKYDDIVIYQAI